MSKVNFERKNTLLAIDIDKFSSPVLARNAIMLQRLIIQFPLYYLSSGRLQEIKNKRKFRTFSSKNGRGGLREVVAYKRF